MSIGQINQKKLNGVDNNLDNSSIKEERETIYIKMNDTEEYVYSNLGLSPALILDLQPQNENIDIKIIKDEETNSSKELEATNNINTSSNLDIKDENISDKVNIITTKDSFEEKAANISKEDEESAEINESNNDQLENSVESISNNNEEEIDDTRRRRRRSSASN